MGDTTHCRLEIVSRGHMATSKSRFWKLATTAFIFVLFGGTAGVAHAYTFHTDPAWHASLNNTIKYVIGTRLRDVNPDIGNNPGFDEGDYKFANKWDIVTNRLSLFTEFALSYKGKYGFRVSASAWNDFAYNDHAEYHPGDAAPGVPYSSLNSYKNSIYSHRTKRAYVKGIRLYDAFAYANFSIHGHPLSVKLGNMTRTWGTALFFAREAISYSQNGSDFVKQVGAPGTTLKQLAVPRLQADVQFNLLPYLQLEFQHYLRDTRDLLIQGGTFLGGGDSVYGGPDFINGAIPHGRAHNGTGWGSSDWGVRLAWSPLWLRGGAGLYYRHYREVEPWAVLFRSNGSGGLQYLQSYNSGVDMIGFSLARQVGTVSVGFEANYRFNGALPTTANPAAPAETGATGDTVNIIANAIVPLTPTPFYDTGTFITELGFNHLTRVTSHAALYNSTDNPAVCPSGETSAGCSTRNQLGIAVAFTPQWLQVLPGVDLSLPLFAEYGIYGNAAALGVFAREGGLFSSAGLSANIFNKYSVTLAYHKVYYPMHGDRVTFNNAGGPAYIAGGNGFYFYNDKDWLSLTLKADF